jgi:hypothetical protein
MERQSFAPVTRHGAATPAERAAAYRARRKANAAEVPAKPPVVIRYRRPADRRSRPLQWADAVQALADLLDQFQEWRDNLPSSLADSATAEALDAVLELRGHVEDLQAVELSGRNTATSRRKPGFSPPISPLQQCIVLRNEKPESRPLKPIPGLHLGGTLSVSLVASGRPGPHKALPARRPPYARCRCFRLNSRRRTIRALSTL